MISITHLTMVSTCQTNMTTMQTPDII